MGPSKMYLAFTHLSNSSSANVDKMSRRHIPQSFYPIKILSLAGINQPAQSINVCPKFSNVLNFSKTSQNQECQTDKCEYKTIFLQHFRQFQSFVILFICDQVTSIFSLSHKGVCVCNITQGRDSESYRKRHLCLE